MIKIEKTMTENTTDLPAEKENDKRTDATQVLLTPRQASAFLNIPVQTLAIWRCTKRVALRWVKVGRHVRYRMSDLLAFLEANARGAV